MESAAIYSSVNNLASPQYNAGNIAVTAFGLSMAYNPISIQLPQQMLQPEDPPETLHMPWGIWLHKRDPLHSIHQRYDTEHLIRTTRVAEDILHYARYAPIIEGPDHEHSHGHEAISYASKFEYDSFDGQKVYGIESGDKNGFKAASAAKTSHSESKKASEEGNIPTAAKELEKAEEPDETPTINFFVKPKYNKINNPAPNSPELEARIIKIIIEQIVSLKLFEAKN